MGRMAALPSLEAMKREIVRNADDLGLETKVAIIRLVVMEVGHERDGRTVVAAGGSPAAPETNINLDAVAEFEPDVIAQIYSIVCARMAALSRPAGAGR